MRGQFWGGLLVGGLMGVLLGTTLDGGERRRRRVVARRRKGEPMGRYLRAGSRAMFEAVRGLRG